MKQKIITALKTKYQRFGLSNEAIDRIASAKEKTVTNEEEIEAAIADAETMELIATELQKSADKERREKSTLQKSFDEYKTKHPDGEGQETDPDPNKEPEWARKLREQNETLAARFKADDDAKQLAAIRASVEGKLKAAGCTNPGILNLTLKDFALLKDETEDAAVERLKGEYNASYKETFGEGGAPGFGSPSFGDAKTAVESKNKFLREQGLLPKEEK